MSYWSAIIPAMTFTLGWVIGAYQSYLYIPRHSSTPDSELNPGEDEMISKNTLRRTDEVRDRVNELPAEVAFAFVAQIAIQFIDDVDDDQEFRNLVEGIVNELGVLAPTVVVK